MLNPIANIDLFAQIAIAKGTKKLSDHLAEKKAARTEKRDALKAELETIKSSK